MNKTEILHYLRTSSHVNDKRLTDMIDSCIAEVNNTVKPKTIYRIFDCKVSGDTVVADNYEFKSKRLAQTVDGCGKVCIFAVTLGTECDRLLRLYSSSDITKTAVLQAVLAAKTEEVCDAVEDELKGCGLTLRRRYSPGYFDLDISEQKKIFSMLEITKRIGVALSDTCQMTPTKSVTAIIGIE